MKKTILLGAITALLLCSMPVMKANAQLERGGVESSQANTRAARRAQKEKTAAPAPLYPAATRQDPKPEGSKALAKKVAKLFELQEKDDYDQTIQLAEEIAASADATPYDRATANYFAGFAWASKDTDSYANAISFLKKAIDANGLNNNTHFQIMLQVAQMEMNEEKYADAVATVDRFLTETKSDDGKAWALKGNALYRLERYADSAAALNKAIAASEAPDDQLVRMLVADYQELNKPLDAARTLEGLLAKNPNDKVLMLNLASAYHDADDDGKASQVLERMRSQGLMTDTKDYEGAYRLMANMEGKDKETVALINEGLAKGVLAPGYDVYAYLGNTYYNADQVPQAIDAWSKAAPLAKDGEMYLNLAKLQVSEDKWADSRSAARQALAKGVRRPGEAWIVIGRAEFGLGNQAAVIAAYKEAAKYPETRKAAEAELRRAGVK